MHRLQLAFLAAVLLSAGARGQTLDPIVASAIAGTRTPALAAIIIRDEKVADQAIRGVRHNDSPIPAQLNDVWHIGSDGKAMTATMIARLVDRGRLSWTSRLADLLPDLAANMRSEYQSVTLLQLLSHTSGLPHDVNDTRFFSTFYQDRRPLSQQRLSYVERALSEAPVSGPGTTFSYSNTGFIVAAVVAERLTGSSYEQLMRQEVFAPLGMATAGFGSTPSGQPLGHHDGRPALSPQDANPMMFAPAGNIHLSMADWAKFCLDQIAGARGRGKLLTAASYRIMQTPQGASGNGLGWGVQDSVMGRKGPALTHAGSDGNWYAVVVLLPQSGNGILVAANAGEDMGGDKAAKAVMQAMLPTLAPPK
jgi:CubicO group peptidase (beta-lactamase class C family)